ncbi:MAG: SAM-dependent methyltransferase [Nitrosomonas sp.]|nr:MAG: SAM-dependent methyltransferase [Nitrosomonas sp.]
MSINNKIKSPDEIALTHSRRTAALIRDDIAAAGGWITFEHYMNLALYAPGLGYYTSGATKLGRAGDFVTAPEISALFGRTLARQLVQIHEQLGDYEVLEFGAGSGKLALDLLLELEQIGALPEKYFILDVSADLQQRQRALFAQAIPHLQQRITWLARLPDRFTGIILANEVLDAMPAHLVVWHDNALFERGVTWRDRQFAWQDRLLENQALLTVAGRLRAVIGDGSGATGGYLSEINLAALGFMRSLAQLLQRGVILLIDYGFGEREYYHPQRQQGTLMCHYRHHAHADPFFFPGLQDITSHVDFTALAQAAIENKLQFLGYTTQANFLINCGITDVLARIPAEETGSYLPLSNQLQQLVSPAEMGELFKVIAFGKECDMFLNGFRAGDISRLL